MPIKNYTTKMPVTQSLAKIQENLISHGATGIMTEYEKGTGRIESLKFLLEINNNKVAFSLPINCKKFQEVLKQQGVKRCQDDDYVYRVAWANIRDWVDAQMALLETETVTMPQIFLPFANDSDGNTLYDKIITGGLLIDSPKK